MLLACTVQDSRSWFILLIVYVVIVGWLIQLQAVSYSGVYCLRSDIAPCRGPLEIGYKYFNRWFSTKPPQIRRFLANYKRHRITCLPPKIGMELRVFIFARHRITCFSDWLKCFGEESTQHFNLVIVLTNIHQPWVKNNPIPSIKADAWASRLFVTIHIKD